MIRIRLPMWGHKFDLWSRKTPHAVEQLNGCTTTTGPALWAFELQELSLVLLKPACLEPMLHKRSYCSEKPTYCNKE